MSFESISDYAGEVYPKGPIRDAYEKAVRTGDRDDLIEFLKLRELWLVSEKLKQTLPTLHRNINFLDTLTATDKDVQIEPCGPFRG